MAVFQEIVDRLCSSAKIDRDKGAVELQRFVADESDKATIRDLEKSVLILLRDESLPWESRHGGLMAAKVLVFSEQLPDKNKHCSEEFPVTLRDCAVKLLEDQESRVRLAAGDLMGVLCMRDGPEVYASLQELILDGVRKNLERQGLENEEDVETLSEKLGSARQRRDSTGSTGSTASEIFHDTAGWRNLETWMKCLQAMIDGCGSAFNPFITQDLLDLIFTALNHTNRFVRETGYYVCASLVTCNTSDEEMTDLSEENSIFKYGDILAKQLATGLSDNWSQVRLAASVATRNFLKGFSDETMRERYYPSIIPPLCLNRYYIAEGVRIYNQDTWRQITDGKGRNLVEQYISNVVEFYIKQTEADNHAVREAACACIAELGSKIGKEVVRPHVAALLDALLVCFKDESWPVRDASCVACGNFILCFPEESKGAMKELYPLFYENLQDNISSVRQGAALALANVVRAYNEEALEVVLKKLQEGLEGLKNQPENSQKYSQLEKGPATYSVVKKMRDNDTELHTDKQMYSCGSLAPKMHRGKRDGGCMDHQFRKPSEPWELADGCVHLLSELAQISKFSPSVSKYIPDVAKAAEMKHYTQHVHFLETVCKQLPNIAKGIGKKPFKTYLESFFDPIFYSLSCDNALTSSAASQCLNQLSSLFGPNILKGRVELYNPDYLQQLESNQFIAPF